MFYRAAAFNQDIGGWNTAQVGSMGTVESTSPRDTCRVARTPYDWRIPAPDRPNMSGVYVINQSCLFGSVPLAAGSVPLAAEQQPRF